MTGLRVTPTSSVSARVQDFMLRKAKTTRLVFRPMPVDNIHAAEAKVKGDFVFQCNGDGGGVEDRDEYGEPTVKLHLYLVRESKGALDKKALRVAESERIYCAERHSRARGVNYGVVTQTSTIVNTSLRRGRYAH